LGIIKAERVNKPLEKRRNMYFYKNFRELFTANLSGKMLILLQGNSFVVYLLLA